jgi:hypothetical protein
MPREEQVSTGDDFELILLKGKLMKYREYKLTK